MADQEIKTSIDALVAYLSEHGETGIGQLSVALGIGEATVIDWANILERAGIVKIAYKAGKMYLSPRSLTKEDAQVLAKKEGAQKAEIRANVASQASQLAQLEGRLEQASKTLSGVDSLFKTKYKELKSMLDSLSALQAQMDGSYRKIMQRKNETEELHAKIQQELESAQRYSENLQKVSIDTNNARAIAQDINRKIALYQKSLDDLDKTLSEAVKNGTTYAKSLRTGINDGLVELRTILGVEEKQLAEYERIRRSYTSDSKAVSERISRERAKSLDEMEKSKHELDRLSAEADKKAKAIGDEIANVKKQFGVASELSDKVAAIRTEIETVSAKKEFLSKQVNELLDEIKAAEALPESRTTEKSERLNSADKKAKKVSKLNEQLRDEAGKMEKDLREL